MISRVVPAVVGRTIHGGAVLIGMHRTIAICAVSCSAVWVGVDGSILIGVGAAAVRIGMFGAVTVFSGGGGAIDIGVGGAAAVRMFRAAAIHVGMCGTLSVFVL